MTEIISRDARAAIVREKGGDFLLENVKMQLTHADDVLVKITATGICHSDLIMRDQFFPFPLPGILGHEGAGVVEEVGANVKNLKAGDHVVLSYMSCAHCKTCDEGEPAYCENFFGLNVGGAREDGSNSTVDADGNPLHDHFFGQSSFGNYALADHRNAIKVDKDVPLEMLGPLGCGIQTGAGAVLNSLAVKSGSSIAIFGAGAVGLSALMAAKIAGATTIISIDPKPDRLALATELGATHVINPMEDDAVEAIMALTTRGVDYSLETSGLPAVLRQSIDVLAIRGTCGILGAPPLGTEASFDINAMVVPGRTIRGICEGDAVSAEFIPQMIEHYKKGQFPFDKLITYFPFDQINEAVAASIEGSAIKPVLRMLD